MLHALQVMNRRADTTLLGADTQSRIHLVVYEKTLNCIKLRGEYNPDTREFHNVTASLTNGNGQIYHLDHSSSVFNQWIYLFMDDQWQNVDSTKKYVSIVHHNLWDRNSLYVDLNVNYVFASDGGSGYMTVPKSFLIRFVAELLQ